MAWTAAEIVRIEAIERQINKLQIAIKNLASATQVRNIAVLKQKEIDDLKNRVTSLESQIEILQKNTI